MRPQKVFFLLFILLAGGATEATWRLRNHLDFVPLGWRVFGGRFYGPSSSFEDEKSVEVAAGTVVAIENAFGGVRVTRGEPGHVRIVIRKVVFLPAEADARALAGRVEIRAQLDGGRLEIGTNRADLERSGALADAGLETHFDVAVPPGTAVGVRNEHGRIDVADVARADVDGAFEPIHVERVGGDASIKGHHAEVTVSSVGGALILSARHGSAVIQDVAGRATVDVEHGDVSVDRAASLVLDLKHGNLEANGVRGDVEFKGEHAAVRLSDVSGRAGVRTTFDDVQLEKIGGEAYVKTEHGAVNANDIGGALKAEATFDAVQFSKVRGHADVSVEHGGVRGRALSGGAVVRVSGDQVDLADFRGAVQVDVRNGGAHLAPGAEISAPVSVTTQHGTITMDIPEGSRFDLQATAHPGNVNVSFGGFSASESGESRVVGRSGSGGSAVTLAAEHGDVRVGSGEKRASNDE